MFRQAGAQLVQPPVVHLPGGSGGEDHHPVPGIGVIGQQGVHPVGAARVVIELLPAQQVLLPPEDQALVKGGGPL